MADILNLGEISIATRVKPGSSVNNAPGGADIIFFPGVRYERESTAGRATPKQDIADSDPPAAPCS